MPSKISFKDRDTLKRKAFNVTTIWPQPAVTFALREQIQEVFAAPLGGAAICDRADCVTRCMGREWSTVKARNGKRKIQGRILSQLIWLKVLLFGFMFLQFEW